MLSAGPAEPSTQTGRFGVAAQAEIRSTPEARTALTPFLDKMDVIYERGAELSLDWSCRTNSSRCTSSPLCFWLRLRPHSNLKQLYFTIYQVSGRTFRNTGVDLEKTGLLVSFGPLFYQCIFTHR